MKLTSTSLWRGIDNVIFVIWWPLLDRSSLFAVSSQRRFDNRRAGLVPSCSCIWLYLRPILSSTPVSPRNRRIWCRVPARSIYIQGRTTSGQCGRGHRMAVRINDAGFCWDRLRTSCMYLASVATCAKNYANSRYRGFAIALPISAFGLSAMWQSQVGAHLLNREIADGSSEVDVFRYFVFLAGLLMGVGVLGFFSYA